MAKPIGPLCNLNCSYCYYLEKRALYGTPGSWRMPEDILEQYVRQYIQSQPTPEVHFAWQGGEPTLIGLEFFRKVVELQKIYAAGKTITNALQTNGTLLDDSWCEFLARHKFLVGVSVDGPRELHDAYRQDKHGKPTFASVMGSVARLRKHHVDFNTLTAVNRRNSYRPLEVYRFLKEIGSTYMQFIPVVERRRRTKLQKQALTFAQPIDPGLGVEQISVTGWSVDAAQYGRFLCAIFEEWVCRDVGRTFVQLFDATLGRWLGSSAGPCVFAKTCGTAVVLEHGGDVYSCDHYVYPAYRLGNIMRESLSSMMSLHSQIAFGQAKADALPQYCRQCSVRFACNGGCPKHRFCRAPDGEMGLSYLCNAYKRFFAYTAPYMQTMARLVTNGYEASEIMRNEQ